MAQAYDIVIKGTGMGVGEKVLVDNLLLLKEKIYLLILFSTEKELNLQLKDQAAWKT